MEEERVVHKVWKEYQKLRTKGAMKPIIGKYQYIFSSKKGKISCVRFINYFMDGKDFWEIYCLEGNLFEDIERFDTFDEAKEKCEELLDG